LLLRSKSPDHYAKGTPSHGPSKLGHGAPTVCERTVSGTISLPSRAAFHLSLTVLCSLSVTGEYLALGGGPPRFRRGFTCPALLGSGPGPFRLRLQGFHLLWPCISSMFVSPSWSQAVRPTTPPEPKLRRFGLFPFRSPLLRESRFLSLPPGTEMFHFPGLPSATYAFSDGYRSITRGGLPHSEIPGSACVCHSPGLFAACHVLHRLPVPRHPPCALSNLSTCKSQRSPSRILSALSNWFKVGRSFNSIFSCQRATPKPALAAQSPVIVTGEIRPYASGLRPVKPPVHFSDAH
jgi:hypothetical protein